ncbi:hypothetical protein [Nocardioides sp. LS1]|uniref:hypothetical protein n=1 Tax=Nocardioides sp. LS1 TaxID=1027620 RepID=UPI000F623D25|nr:hypothetical protein [Nocardioides sp. LS1]GCD88648.1 hypothetical protein NLS1_06540 [Nocardioides sp. LS1]
MSVEVPPLFAGLCDDAAVFPPGNLPLADAVPAHAQHRAAAYAPMVGAFVLAAKDLEGLASLVASLAPRSFRLSLTVPLRQVAAAVGYVDALAAAQLESVEVALPDDARPAEVVPSLERALGDRSVPVFVELPRDERRAKLVDALLGTGLMAKLRTGGVRADLYPDESELAAAVASLAAAGVPFKATAGLHHAVRNTDRQTGFEQHGFLNLLTASGAVLDGAGVDELANLLADRDGTRVADRVRTLPAEVRDTFRSFGTCSITEPVEELAGLGLIDTRLTENLA